MRQPFVNDIEASVLKIPNGIGKHTVRTFFSFRTNLVDSYEKYPESVILGLTKIGGILAFVRIVSLALFYLHRYLFESHINKELSLKEEGEDDIEKDS